MPTPFEGPPGAVLQGDAFARAFPFHMQLDAQMRVVGIGHSLHKIVPTLRMGDPLQQWFQIMRPHGLHTAQDWQRKLGELCTLTSVQPPQLTLRGSAEAAADGGLLLLVSPVLGTLEEQTQLGLTFTDFAKHDAIGDSLILSQTTRLSCQDAERLSQRLRSRTDQLTTILDLSHNGVAFFDANHALLHVNKAFLSMLGLERIAAMDMSLQAIDNWLESLCPAEQNIRKPFAWLMDTQNDSANGITVPLERPRRAVIHVDSAQSAEGSWVFYLRDVTHETEVDRMKSEFLSAAAHELRTPMVSIFGFTELLIKRTYSPERQTDMLLTIHRQSGLLVKMINELLDLARIESRQGMDFQIVPHPLTELVQTTVKGLMRAETDRQVTVMAVPDVQVMVDPQKMQLALSNLLNNAFKYSPEGGPVTLRGNVVRTQGHNYAVLEIRDQGIGMTREQLQRAFERFYRADASGNIPGTGLGLCLVKEVAELHKGKVDLASEAGVGTTARLWIPLHKSEGLRSPLRTPPAQSSAD